MISPSAMALAAMTLMLWILWSDTVRPRRPSPILYAVRIALYLIVAGVLVLDLVRYHATFSTSARVLVVIAILVGLFGAGYFGKKLVRRAEKVTNEGHSSGRVDNPS